jgi:hypothetical protein
MMERPAAIAVVECVPVSVSLFLLTLAEGFLCMHRYINSTVAHMYTYEALLC